MVDGPCGKPYLFDCDRRCRLTDFQTLCRALSESAKAADQNVDLSAEGPILIVDDDPALLRLCDRVLSTKGYSVRTAGNGEEALRMVDEEEFRVVLFDLKMPGMDCIQVLGQLKSVGCRADIVMVT